MCTAEAIHAFESRGLGKAPFRCVGLRENRFTIPGVPEATKPGGTCDYCGTGIAYECVIQSADGRQFVVGCDCVLKTDDRGLVSAVKLAQRKARQEKAAAKHKAAWEAERPERERRQRVRDIIASERSFAARNREAAMTEQNGWLIDVLNGMSGDFVASMAEQLRTNRLGDLSDRCISILREIYAKHHGRRNSKAYSAAEDVFDSHLEA
jgi:vacuolar-type H+-ATPase subunit H